MALKTLSLVVTDQTRDASALRAAVGLATREDAHLNLVCLGVEAVMIDAAPMGATPVLLESWHNEAQGRAEALAAWASAAIPSGNRATVEPLTAQGLSLAAIVAWAARFSDLAVAARPYGSGSGGVAPVVAEGLLFGTGAPVLFVPDAAADWSRPFRRICLGWNDSDEALNAARGALPFLRQAEKVDIVIIDPPVYAHDRSEPGEAVSLWLSRHGVKAEVAVLAQTEPRVADILMRFARERSCEAIVMGAYGHSRLREALLGGATRDMLTALPLPLIMAH